ncbi:TonB-dependent receptor [Sphingosinicella sp. LHD-64]|uniref:TonB-dependent receptor domain-containing protein n=1 Tax=Sphingosinicella sp. LHD-64 TaxID=3072139 RepID=UPI00280DEC6D|nr:TonB-dependent receptor [Sphingosinicella sp. LHD-64]MDQ8757528.1 TonB-dependent receptor [Sphingosinicella sp. LHD-64]
MLLGTAASLFVTAAPAFAQDAQPPVSSEPETASDEGQAIVITGSRIARRDLTSTSPVTVVSNEEFRLSGAVNVEQVINTLPQVVPGSSAFSNNPGGGIATLDLRGLGSQRNLVLVNGRRYIFFDTAQTVDLNTIPQFLIDSVDVVTGGASAVYGSDAVAGVINFRLRSDLDGLLAGAQYSITEEGDGARYNAYLAMGTQFADGRGNITIYGEYFNRGQIMQADRPWAFFSFGDGADGLIPLGSASVPQGRIVAPGSILVAGVARPIAAGTNYVGPVGSNPGGAFFSTPGTSIPYCGAPCSYNYAPANYLMVPQERWTLGGYGEYEIADGITAYAEVNYINNRVQNELAATPITQNVDFELAAIQPLVSAADFTQLQQIATNQQAAIAAAAAAGAPNPFGPFTAGTASFPALQPGFVRLNVNSRTTGLASRNVTDDRNAFRVLAGLRGNITDSLTYDVYYMYARTRNASVQTGNISRSAFTRLAADGTCNVFGEALLSADCINQISILAQNQDISELQVAQASISGPLFTFGTATDPVAFAAGVEWRSVSGQFIPDTALSSGDVVGFNAGQATQGSYDVKEVFAELRVPIIQDNFIHRLELNGAGRYSDYSLGAVGGVWTYAGGIELAPIRDITFRGQYQRAIRAPNVGELFGGRAIGFPAATDPCSLAAAATNPTVRALCVATGVPDPLVGTAGLQPNAQVPGVFGGNPNLEEEVADTWTAGAVIRPRFIPRLNITIDYYDIRIENAVAPAAGGVNNILNLCYNVIQDVNSALCQAIGRNPLTGVIEGGDFVVEATFANLGSFDTSGIDFQVDYSLPLNFSLLNGSSSRLNFFFLGNYTRTADFTPVAGLDQVNEGAGRYGNIIGNPVAKWKWSSRLSWMDGPLTTSIRWRHLGAVRDDDDSTDYIVERIGAYDLFDISFAFEVNDNFTVNLGINNLFDKDPPLLGDNQAEANTFPEVYDVLGRDFFISASFRF